MSRSLAEAVAQHLRGTPLEHVVPPEDRRGPGALAATLVCHAVAHPEPVARALEGLLLGLPPLAWPAVEREVRKNLPWIANRPASLLWMDLAPVDLGPVGRLSREPWLVAAATWHRNGRVRESALRRLPVGSAWLPFVLLRLNDWVEPIRLHARRRLDEFLRPGREDRVPRWLPLVDWLASCGRADHGEAIAGLLDAAAHPDAWPALSEALDAPWRRQVYPVAARALPGRTAFLVDRALGDPDPAVCGWAAGLAAQLPADAERGQRMRRSRDARVRATGVLALKAEGRSDGALEHADDPNPGVRLAARWVAGPLDWAGHYRALLSALEGEPAAGPPVRPGCHHPATESAAHGERHPAMGSAEQAAADRRRVVGSLLGLGETGSPADAHATLPWLAHPSPRVRHAALTALGRLDVDGSWRELERALDDPSPRVARVAFEALAGHPRAIPLAHLEERFRSAHGPGRLMRLRLLALGPYWSSLPLLLRAATDPQPGPTALELLSRLRGSGLQPRPEDLHALREALAAAGPTLSPERRRDLEGALDWWQRRLGP